MKYLSEFRDPKLAKKIAKAIANISTQKWKIMEICGGQTHSIVKFAIKELLPKNIDLIHGPGCPVCVTPLSKIDLAIFLALKENVIVCSYGDMLRVPGSSSNLLECRASGGNVEVIYSPLDALTLAEKHPDKEIVLFAIGFETTAPTNALAVFFAKQKKLYNFSIIVSQVLVPPAIRAILQNSTIDGFLAAGHVCTVMGYKEYIPLAEEYKLPIVVTGFEPIDILEGLYRCIYLLENKKYGVENQYTRSVRKGGNESAMQILDTVFELCSMEWRGIGQIEQSGYALRKDFHDFDAEKKFQFNPSSLAIITHDNQCIAGEILQGRKKPQQCPSFGKQCTPESPIGAPMVSTEGACAAYFHHTIPSSRS
jgi:hydrogenase expression/formation protein HypD